MLTGTFAETRSRACSGEPRREPGIGPGGAQFRRSHRKYQLAHLLTPGGTTRHYGEPTRQRPCSAGAVVRTRSDLDGRLPALGSWSSIAMKMVIGCPDVALRSHRPRGPRLAPGRRRRSPGRWRLLCITPTRRYATDVRCPSPRSDVRIQIPAGPRRVERQWDRLEELNVAKPTDANLNRALRETESISVKPE